MAKIIDGKKIAEKIINEIKLYTTKLIQDTNVTPHLAVILIGENDASKTYVRTKMAKAKKCGFQFTLLHFNNDVMQEAVLQEIKQLNNNPKIHGILVQLPLPSHINANLICQTITPKKDVDGFCYPNVGQLWSNNQLNYENNEIFLPCTPLGIMHLLYQIYDQDLSGKNTVVVGRSNIVGKPIAGLLLSHNATLTIAHSKSKNLAQICQQADILIIAAGKPEFITSDYIKDGATIIDVGINYIFNQNQEKQLKGDVNFAQCSAKASYITPVPGGVGPMTIAMLMYNSLKAACLQADYPILKLH